VCGAKGGRERGMGGKSARVEWKRKKEEREEWGMGRDRTAINRVKIAGKLYAYHLRYGCVAK